MRVNKKVIVAKSAQKEFKKLSKNIRAKIDSRVMILSRDGKLIDPFGKKIDDKLFEIRVKVGSQWRVLYAYIWDNHVILLSVFQKKTNKTPSREIVKARKRLEEYL
ncbi:MAG: type II toxin-antitoxin system RelE/ParE family toxin [Candidatus Pacebacteria bacterium]|jgi:phage-related protein|nr:type II toxin-antitoxin system RelE/ParE family toxin [Candidatus Paceibacterota bacterium]MBT3511967.1 type II toxin-antitoxin system RelE/ParE family toxin [Candidatus Paceibacterota bacterium]MBT4005289.1 type II toxin-antitoxin system RelE/ParE family toxin [Candidatus Paceibacterota bacterium]MBT4358508.1 type II toxin-antitoxin system RelE/ParE family toxin [Candidatus Paceibacterota bacterium]MBT4681156.1 type II toxin-antitoxin system RelE/ParE family toxin [Candidatus Paceibacterota